MLFFRSKTKPEELLPPPPPFPTLELEEKEEGPVLFDEVAKPEKAEGFPEEREFNDLVKELENGLKPAKEVSEKEKISAKKKAVVKKQKIQKKEIKEQKQAKVKKTTQLKKAKITEKLAKTPKAAKLPKPEGLGVEGIDFALPKEIEPSKEEINLPGTLEDFSIEDIKKELGVEEDAQEKPSAYSGFERLGHEAKKPKEILEAEEEIQNAIEKIKKQERPSFFRRLFAKKEKEEKPEGRLAIKPEADEVFIIKDSISKTREALTRLDLKTAKRNYIEIIKLYNRVKPEEQAKVYQDIRELYFERKSAEGLKI